MAEAKRTDAERVLGKQLTKDALHQNERMHSFSFSFPVNSIAFNNDSSN